MVYNRGSGTYEWNDISCNGRCGDVHVALSQPLPYCAPGEAPPDVLGLATLDVFALWKGEGTRHRS